MTYEEKRFYIDRASWLSGEAMRAVVPAPTIAAAAVVVFTDKECRLLQDVPEKIVDALSRVLAHLRPDVEL